MGDCAGQRHRREAMHTAATDGGCTGHKGSASEKKRETVVLQQEATGPHTFPFLTA